MNWTRTAILSALLALCCVSVSGDSTRVYMFNMRPYTGYYVAVNGTWIPSNEFIIPPSTWYPPGLLRLILDLVPGDIITVTDSLANPPTGIRDGLPAPHIRLIPNPFESVLTVVSSAPGTIEFYDVAGRPMGSQRLAIGHNRIARSGTWPSGVYFYRVNMHIGKIVKIR